ncbi:MAG TPA: L,D-transpeptidase family protein [Prosthecobacter sp.]
MFLILVASLMAGLVFFSFSHRWKTLAKGVKADRVRVEKSARRLTLLSKGNTLKVYRISLGTVPEGTKEKEGDGRTPEGVYTLDSRNPHSAYHLALHVSYPDAKDRQRAVKSGLSCGGDIMIHGMPDGWAWLGSLHRFWDWTAGCMAVTNVEMEEIWRAVPVGTPIEILP